MSNLETVRRWNLAVWRWLAIPLALVLVFAAGLHLLSGRLMQAIIELLAAVGATCGAAVLGALAAYAHEAWKRKAEGEKS